MRISDWSSDVCSSGLTFFAKFAHNDVTASNRRHSRESGNPVTSAPSMERRWRSTMHRSVIVRRHFKPLGSRFRGNDDEGCGDRKSVGWGKSVSVRVDLGGGRIIKNKNKTKTKT